MLEERDVRARLSSRQVRLRTDNEVRGLKMAKSCNELLSIEAGVQGHLTISALDICVVLISGFRGRMDEFTAFHWVACALRAW